MAHMTTDRYDNDNGPSRRTVLRAAGGIGLLGAAVATGRSGLLGLGASPTADAQAATRQGGSPLSTLSRNVGAACVELTPEVTEGPFYLPDELIRKDIREKQDGFVLDFTFRVMNSKSCTPIAQAAVDIWHCNALGAYSGVAEEAEGLQAQNSDTFLRGIQLTNESGHCRFTTIVPGWYPGRAVHIHVKVHVGGTVSHRHYSGGTVCHTGQVFFAERMLSRIQVLDPYRQNSASRLHNDDDGIYHQAGGTSAIAQTKALHPGDPTKGYRGSIILGVDPNAD
jgi:protocatechuate 3,4-dioxygenase beta subunit